MQPCCAAARFKYVVRSLCLNRWVMTKLFYEKNISKSSVDKAGIDLNNPLRTLKCQDRFLRATTFCKLAEATQICMACRERPRMITMRRRSTLMARLAAQCSGSASQRVICFALLRYFISLIRFFNSNRIASPSMPREIGGAITVFNTVPFLHVITAGN